MTEQTAQQQFDAWAREQIKGRAAFKIPDLVARAEEHFGRDTAFLKAFMRQMLRSAFQARIMAILWNARSSVAKLGGQYVHPDRMGEAADDEVLAVWGRWAGWRERMPDGSEMRLLEMRDKDLAAAEAVCFERAAPHIRKAEFYRAIRPGMKRGKKLQDCYTPEALEEIRVRTLGDGAAQDEAAA